MVLVVNHENFMTLGAILPLPTSALYLNKYEKNGTVKLRYSAPAYKVISAIRQKG